MRFLLMISLLFSPMVFANCNVYIPVKSFNLEGYVINFDFTKMLIEKKYTEVYSPDVADHTLKVEGIEQEGSFHRAVGLLEMGSYQAKESVLCLTALCGVSDYGKAFSKSYKKLSALIPVCQ